MKGDNLGYRLSSMTQKSHQVKKINGECLLLEFLKN